MSTAEKRRITPQEYLAVERKAEFKSEYFAGETFAMVGASRKHNLISLNTGRELSQQLKDRDCEVYVSDMRVKVNPTGLYTYPDVVVVCGGPEFEDEELDTLLNPTAICEVLSDSTEDYDRGRKFTHYRRIPSLKEYVLIAQNEPRIEQFLRQPDGRWVLSETDDPNGTIELPSIGGTLSMPEVYLKVAFENGASKVEDRR